MKTVTLTMITLLSMFQCCLLNAQHHHCATTEAFNARVSNNPSILTRQQETETEMMHWIQENTVDGRAVITIPVVVHVLYNTAAENIPDSQITSQIQILNQDFNKLNEDTANVPAVWQSLIANVGIEFCLASVDPLGNPTTGITRTYTDSAFFTFGLNQMKLDATGGKDGWDGTQYLNIWVAKLNAGWLGEATFPSELAGLPQADGVVIRPEAFGTGGLAGTGIFTTNNGGRTGTHEVGHWLSLYHIWADGDSTTCPSDSVADTPPATSANNGSPTFPHNVGVDCATDPNGEMFMNYMDYSDDASLWMFTNGQKARMLAAINLYRSDILSSNGCGSISASLNNFQNLSINAFPNPAHDLVNFSGLQSEKKYTVEIADLQGKIISTSILVNNQINVSNLSNGIYVVKILNENSIGISKIIIQH